jgi:sugar phosphate isomerase/epimerase
VEDIGKLADMLAVRGFRLAYENWCWATNASTWSKAWDIVRRVDRDNVGLCLDTFQIAGSEWADPTTKSGLIESDSRSIESLKEEFDKSLATLSKTVPKNKIFLLQISDAFRMEPPLPNEPNEEGLRPRGQWSHDFRPLPFDGGYLPMVDVTKAVLGTGFAGWISVEVFNSSSHKEIDVKLEARRGMDSCRLLLSSAR